MVAGPTALLYVARSQGMLDSLASVALWSTWTLLVSGLIVEIVEAVAGRRGRSTALPHIGGPLRLVARWLVGSVVAAWGIFALPGTATARPALPAGDVSPATSTKLASTPAEEQSLPAASLPARPADDTDEGTSEEDGTGSAAAGDEAQAIEVTVAQGDSFWALAERELADAWGRVPTDSEVAPYWQGYIDGNLDRLLPPGDPDVIYADQVFAPPTVPGDPTVEQPAAEAGDDAPDSSDTPEPTDEEPTGEEAAPADEAPAEDGVTGSDGTPPEASDDATTAPTAPDNAAAPPPETPDAATAPSGSGTGEPNAPQQPAAESLAHADDQEGGSSLRSALAPAGGLALGGALLMLHRRRRAQQRHRRRGDRLVPPGSQLQASEEELIGTADEDSALRLDATMRAAAAGAGSNGLPALRWVEASPHATMLVLESRLPAPAWFSPRAGNGWLSTAATEDLEAQGASVAAPTPTLVPVGATSWGSKALIELESSGVVTLMGPDGAVQGLLRALALSAATSPWSERTKVVLVGIGGEMGGLPWVSQASFGAALDQAEAHLQRLTEALSQQGCETTAQARASGPPSEDWDPLVVLSAVRPDQPELRRRLRELAAQPHRGVAVVTVAPSDAVLPGRALTIHRNGSMRVDGIDQVVWPQSLEEASCEGLVQLLDHAGRRDDAVYTPVSRSPAASSSSPTEDRADEASDDPARLGIDGLLEDVEVLIRVLGEVEAVRGPGPRWGEKLVATRLKALEAVTYLAARQQPITQEELERSLFPDEADAARRIQSTMKAARSLVGAGLVSAPGDSTYEMSDAVTTDYVLFAELAAQADETDDAHLAARLLTEALDLVQGEPFTGLGRTYTWVEAHRQTITAEVVDAADELAEVRLALGDWRSAEWAARKGLLASPCEERLYRILMRVAQAAGPGRSGARHVFDQLCEAMRDPRRGVAPEDSLHPETLELLEELTGTRPERTSVEAQ